MQAVNPGVTEGGWPPSSPSGARCLGDSGGRSPSETTQMQGVLQVPEAVERSFSSEDDSALAALAVKAPGGEAFRELYERHRGDVFRFLVRLVGEQRLKLDSRGDDVERVVLKAFARLGEGNGSSIDFVRDLVVDAGPPPGEQRDVLTQVVVHCSTQGKHRIKWLLEKLGVLAERQ
jgi:hypothetical protein